MKGVGRSTDRQSLHQRAGLEVRRGRQGWQESYSRRGEVPSMPSTAARSHTASFLVPHVGSRWPGTCPQRQCPWLMSIVDMFGTCGVFRRSGTPLECRILSHVCAADGVAESLVCARATKTLRRSEEHEPWETDSSPMDSSSESVLTFGTCALSL